MQHRANEEARRARDVRGELASRMREWFAGPELERLQPLRNQPMDSVLGERVGLPHTGELLNKRSGANMQIYGRVSEIIREQWGTRIRVALSSAGVSAKLLKAAFARVGRIQLKQMQNPAIRSAGFVLEPQISKTGEIDLCAVITDATAAQKVATRVYTGAVICFDGDEISDVSLIDSPVAFMQKRSTVICKLYDGGGKLDDWKMAKRMSRENGLPPEVNHAALKSVRPVREPALPASAQRVIDEIERTDAILKNGGGGDKLAVQAQNQRARQQIGVEFIKAIRSQPANQLGGPRYQR